MERKFAVQSERISREKMKALISRGLLGHLQHPATVLNICRLKLEDRRVRFIA
jgi:hypothetical protein